MPDNEKQNRRDNSLKVNAGQEVYWNWRNRRDQTDATVEPDDSGPPRLSESSLEGQIWRRFEALSLERLPYREIVDKLAAEGYDRAVVVSLIKRMTTQQRPAPDITSPLIFTIVSGIMFMWGVSPSPATASTQYATVKIFAFAIGGVVLIPSVYALIYKFYDRFPRLHTLFERQVNGQRIVQDDIVQLDQQFLGGQIIDTEYEGQLVALMGIERGKQHFRLMRNHKHFGLD